MKPMIIFFLNQNHSEVFVSVYKKTPSGQSGDFFSLQDGAIINGFRYFL